MEQADVIVIGAGLAGLAAALELDRAGLAPLVLEASDGVGGRVRTDTVDGFRLDRGFQVFLEAYPEARRLLDYDRLELARFVPGARVWLGDELHALADPFRRLSALPSTLTSPVGSLADKLRVWKLRRRALAHDTLTELFRAPDTTAYQALREVGLTRPMIDAFFRPFLGGIFLDRSLSFSSRLLDFVLRMMAEGEISVPDRGMGEIPAQLARRLERSRPGAIRLGSRVARIQPGRVEVAASDERPPERLDAPALVVATDAPTAVALLENAPALAARDRVDEGLVAPDPRGSTCLWFAAPERPYPGRWLLLDGLGEGPVNSAVVMSEVARGYAPAGAHLVAAAVLGVPAAGDAELEAAVRRQLDGWFGRAGAGGTGRWRLLRVDRIPYAQPAQPPGFRDRRAGREAALRDRGIYLAGDWLESASIQGALTSGRRAAEALLADRERERR